MKYAKTVWLTAQGLALICAVGFGFFVLKQRLADAIPDILYVALLCGGMGAAYGFAAQRVLKELRRAKADDNCR